MYRKLILPNTCMIKNRFSESLLPKVFYPNGVKSGKYLLKKFICEETGETVKKFRIDPEEPLNKLPIEEIIDTSEQICWEFFLKNVWKVVKIAADLSFSNWLHLAADIRSFSTFPLNLELRLLFRYADP